MAVTFLTGFEGRSTALESDAGNSAGLAFNGTTSFDTTTFRSGAVSLRCNPASGASGNVQFQNVTAAFVHFGLRVATRPSLARRICGNGTGSTLKLNSDGTLEVFDSSTSRGSSAALNNDQWYWIGWRASAGTTVVVLQIDGVDAVTGTVAVSSTQNIGFDGTEASAVDAYFDDLIVDSAGFLAASKVDMALPISVSATGTGWVGGGGGAAAATAVDNTPPVGVADTGTDTSQIRNATAAANSDMDFNLETYTTLGIAAADTVLALRPVASTAAPVTTSAKQGTVGVSANPVIAQVALAASPGTAGAFWAGAAGGTYSTGWKTTFGTLTTSPSVTLGSSPVMRMRQVTSSTRIAMVCFMGMQVAWTPAAAAERVPFYRPYTQLIPQ